jgi:hypothetical protein
MEPSWDDSPQRVDRPPSDGTVVHSLCADCGALIDPDGARSYTFGEQGVLCWSCAIRRGGSYSAEEEVWTTAPSLADLDES